MVSSCQRFCSLRVVFLFLLNFYLHAKTEQQKCELQNKINIFFLFVYTLWHLYLACKVCESPLKNWGGNVQFKPKKLVFPESNDDVVDIVKNCRGMHFILEIIVNYKGTNKWKVRRNMVSLEIYFHSHHNHYFCPKHSQAWTGHFLTEHCR